MSRLGSLQFGILQFGSAQFGRLRFLSLLVSFGLMVATAGTVLAVSGEVGPSRSHDAISHPASDLPAARSSTEMRADTVQFGYYDGTTGFAIPGETWTFDHGAPDPFEGWVDEDWTNGGPITSSPHWRRIDAATWSGHGNEVAAPIINGSGSAWVGMFEDAADSACWASGLGYGNSWNQRFVSPEMTYTGTGAVTLSFRYFNDSEEGNWFDNSKVSLRLPDGLEVPLNDWGFSGVIGDPGQGVYPTYTRQIAQADFHGSDRFRVVFEFTSDGGWSDEDGDAIRPPMVLSESTTFS